MRLTFNIFKQCEHGVKSRGTTFGDRPATKACVFAATAGSDSIKYGNTRSDPTLGVAQVDARLPPSPVTARSESSAPWITTAVQQMMARSAIVLLCFWRKQSAL